MKPNLRLLALLALLHGCTQTALTTNALVLSNLKTEAYSQNTMIEAFTNICLQNGTSAVNQAEAAKSLEWDSAKKESLKANNLTALRKEILEVPGGGARVSETQQLFQKQDDEQVSFLSIEEKFDTGKHLTTSCSIFSKTYAYLKTCAKTGELLDRAPERNVTYKSSQSQFISWPITMGEHQAKVHCQRTPKAILLPYDGTVLVLETNHQTSVQLTQQSSQLPSDDDMR